MKYGIIIAVLLLITGMSGMRSDAAITKSNIVSKVEALGKDVRKASCKLWTTTKLKAWCLDRKDCGLTTIRARHANGVFEVAGFVGSEKSKNALAAFATKSTRRPVRLNVAVVKDLSVSKWPKYATWFSEISGDFYLKAGTNLKASRLFAEIRALRRVGAHIKTVLVRNGNAIALVICDRIVPELVERLDAQLSMGGIKKLKIIVLKNYKPKGGSL